MTPDMNQVPIIHKGAESAKGAAAAKSAVLRVAMAPCQGCYHDRMPAARDEAGRQLAEVGRRFDARGWVLGTSGNFSLVSGRDPLRLTITASGLFKGQLTADQFLEIDDRCAVVDGTAAKPSAEAQLHVEIV